MHNADVPRTLSGIASKFSDFKNESKNDKRNFKSALLRLFDGADGADGLSVCHDERNSYSRSEIIYPKR